MRALSAGQAATCEGAKSPPARCRCRCGGAFHGANRATPDSLAALPAGDPHLPAQPRLTLRTSSARHEYGVAPR